MKRIYNIDKILEYEPANYLVNGFIPYQYNFYKYCIPLSPFINLHPLYYVLF